MVFTGAGGHAGTAIRHFKDRHSAVKECGELNKAAREVLPVFGAKAREKYCHVQPCPDPAGCPAKRVKPTRDRFTGF